MKKVFALLGLAACSFGFAQGGPLIIKNLSTNYDFHGNIYALNLTGGCYPQVISESPASIIIPAGNTMQYDNYRDQYNGSSSSVATWNVSVAPGSSVIRPWNHPAVMPGGTVSLQTKWAHSKFQMYHAGTSDMELQFNGNIGNKNNQCVSSSEYIDALPMGDASWFTVTSNGTVYTYLVIN